MSQLYHAIKHYRQKLISQTIEDLLLRCPAQHSQEDQDPFEVYHYHQSNDAPLLDLIEHQCKHAIDSFANMAHLKRIREQLKEKEYVIDQQLATSEIENEELQILIQRLQNQEQRQITIDPLIRKRQERSYSKVHEQQTDPIKTKEAGTFTANEGVRKKKHVISQEFSLTLQRKEKEKEPNLAMQDVSQFYNLTSLQHGNGIQLQQTYHELKKEMGYLEYLKKGKNRKQYGKQKQRVKFMMEAFWKNAHCKQNSVINTK